MHHILVVGQTPPPFHGQAIMIKVLLQMNAEDVKLVHVRMNFSRDVNEIGIFRYHKLIDFARVFVSILKCKLRYRPKVLYYPLSPTNTWAATRDILLLLTTRWLFEKIVFHFHAGGLTENLFRLPLFIRLLTPIAFGQPDVTIHLGDFSLVDGKLIHSRKMVIIPYGIEDVYSKYKKEETSQKDDGLINLLFVGSLYESKGIFDLLEACIILKKRGYLFRAKVVGKGPYHIQRRLEESIQKNELEGIFCLEGEKIGDAKWEEYARADIFCFPTYYENETLGLVVVEAMMFGLPVITTHWRGLPSLVKDSENGFLIPIRSPVHLAEKIELLINNKALRYEMGKKGREIFKNRFTIEKFLLNMHNLFSEINKD